MNALINSQNMNNALEKGGWNVAFTAPGHGEGTSGYVGSMADTSISRSPRHLHKRRRLTRLLDRLAIQIQTNNNYEFSRWFGLDPVAERNKSEDGPLDLSTKSEPQDLARGVEYDCPTCGQTFAVLDRLTKHIASRHRNKATESTRVYECEVCFRKFARSDMLTRHARLHSGVKPYSCSACGQVFSRSDHLATHQRTHTGEKPYRCPACPYAACRRDMITRHMRTHTRRPQPV